MIIWRSSQSGTMNSWFVTKINIRRYRMITIWRSLTVGSFLLERLIISWLWQPAMCIFWIRKMKCIAVLLCPVRGLRMRISRHRYIIEQQRKCLRNFNILDPKRQRKLSLRTPIWSLIWWIRFIRAVRENVRRILKILIRICVISAITEHMRSMALIFLRSSKSV